LPESKGNVLLDKFWEANPAIAALKDNVTKFWENKGNKKWLPGIDGRRLITRKKSALLNTLFQSCGAIEKAIEKAGVHLKLSVPLAGEGKVGLNWKETH
jgi:hypothetical protein